MGRIKPALVKRTAKKLMAGENSFTSSFEENKRILGHTMPGKWIRNRLAGYLAKLKKMQAREPHASSLS
jgi:ribosomal protein S17E